MTRSRHILGANGDINSFNLFAYCSNNPVNYYDPSGHLITALIIGGCVLFGIGATMYADYKDDGEIFNGSITLDRYIINASVMGAIGAAFCYLPQIGSFLSNNFTLGSVFIGGEVVAVSVSGAQIVAGTTIAVGATVMHFAKPNSGRIRYSDDTGIDPTKGKYFQDKGPALEYYRTIKDPIKKAHWKKWLKGKGWIRNHLK